MAHTRNRPQCATHDWSPWTHGRQPMTWLLFKILSWVQYRHDKKQCKRLLFVSRNAGKHALCKHLSFLDFLFLFCCRCLGQEIDACNTPTQQLEKRRYFPDQITGWNSFAACSCTRITFSKTSSSAGGEYCSLAQFQSKIKRQKTTVLAESVRGVRGYSHVRVLY